MFINATAWKVSRKKLLPRLRPRRWFRSMPHAYIGQYFRRFRAQKQRLTTHALGTATVRAVNRDVYLRYHAHIIFDVIISSQPYYVRWYSYPGPFVFTTSLNHLILPLCIDDGDLFINIHQFHLGRLFNSCLTTLTTTASFMHSFYMSSKNSGPKVFIDAMFLPMIYTRRNYMYSSNYTSSATLSSLS